jgi:DNA-3-methyladenine glycosylase II
MKRKQAYPFNHRHAIRHLKKADARLAALIDRVGPFRMEMDTHPTPYEALLEAIIYQQLHGKAAATIFGRLKEQVGGGKIPAPPQILAATDAQLRAVGLSRQKTAALRDLAEKTVAGVVPSFTEILKLPDDEILARLTAVRGIGVWTVQMMLLFRLGRPDVFPISDFGVQRGFAITYRRRKHPKPKELVPFGERWRPYRSVASWYLWRAVDLFDAARKAKPAVKKKKKSRK